jgi:hypothetical protein
VRLKILHNVLFIDKIKYAIWSVCARTQAMRSSAAPCEIDCGWHDRSCVTAKEIHGARDKVMAARATRGLRLMWSALDRGSYDRSQTHSIASSWARVLAR